MLKKNYSINLTHNYFDEFKKLSNKYIGIKKGIDFTIFLQNKLKLLQVEKKNDSKKSICFYDLSAKQKLYMNLCSDRTNKYLNDLYVEFLVCEIFYKTEFSKSLILILKKKKLNHSNLKFKSKNIIKNIVLSILKSFLESKYLNENNFDEITFISNLKNYIFFEKSYDNSERIVSDLILIKKKNDFFFYLEQGIFSLKDNFLFMLLNIFHKELKFEVINENDSISFLENLNFDVLQQKISIFENQKLSLNLDFLKEIKKIVNNSLFNEIQFFYSDFYDCNGYKFNIKTNRFFLFFMNQILNQKLLFNYMLFNIFVCSTFNNYVLKIYDFE